MTITAPGSRLTAALPASWYQPLPAVQIRIWPPPRLAWWMCQLLRQPGTKVTLARPTALSPGAVRGFKNESPMKYFA